MALSNPRSTPPVLRGTTGSPWDDYGKKGGFAFPADESDNRLRNAWCKLLEN
jgi:hypothetical protein